MQPTKEQAAPQPTFLEKVKSAAKLKFNADKALAIDLANKCKAIAISDEITLAMATQALSQAGNLLKMLEDKRKEVKKPYKEAGELIDSVAKQISVPLEAGISYGKLEMRKWNDEQDRIQKEKTEKLEKQTLFFSQMEQQLLKKSDECITPESCDKLIASINDKFPEYRKKNDLFTKEIDEMKARYLHLIGIKKDLLEKAIAGGKGSTEAISNMLMKNAEANKQSAVIAESQQLKAEVIQQGINSGVVTSSVRKVWKAEVVDESALPREWLMVDMDKVNAYMKDVVKADGIERIINGVRFFIDKSPSIR